MSGRSISIRSPTRRNVKSFKVATEKQEADKATLAVSIEGRDASARKPVDRTIRYEFVRDAREWKIAKPGSMRIASS
jgi:hypothetical protein